MQSDRRASVFTVIACLAAAACSSPAASGKVTITSFAAEPATISLGQTTSLSWAVSGATTIVIDNGVGDVSAATKTAVKPAATTTYTLTASEGSANAVQTATVTVGPAPDIAIYPQSGYVQTGASLPLLSTPSFTQVTWSLDEASGCGALSSAGVYTAPATATVCHVTATPAKGPVAHSRIAVITGTPGEWVDISPPVNHVFEPLVNYGMQALDGATPDAPKTLYAGTCGYGIWKTTDGGDHWARASTGANSSSLGDGTNGYARNWSLAVDRTDSRTLYTVAGFGKNGNGLYKSTNGAVDWAQILPRSITSVATDDVTNVAIDPTNHLHLLVASHSNWVGANDSGVLESLDGGATWILHPPPPRASNDPATASQSWGTGPIVLFLGQDDNGNPSGSHWLLGGQFGAGIWRTTDSGAHWTRTSDFDRSHAGLGIYRAGNGVLYMGVNNQLARSPDNGVTWINSNAPTGPDAYAGVVGDGTNVWTMLSNTGVGTVGPYHWQISSESDGTHWASYNAQTFADGPVGMLYDPVNHVIYASQWATGVFRLQLP